MVVKAIYNNTFTITPLTILSGESLSPFLNCRVDSDLSGMKSLRAIQLPQNFPACQLNFSVGFLDDGSDLSPITPTDGVDTGDLVVDAFGDRQFIPFFANWFDAAAIIQIKTSIDMSEDVIINAILQPIYGGY